ITKVVEGVETTIAPTIAEEKAQRRLELKARSTLLIGISNEHQLKFNFIKDAKSLLSEVLDHTFDRLQKLISQLKIHGESISQEDVNQKFLRSLLPEWNTHTIVWRNMPKIDTLSLDDLYNNPKIYEPEDLQQIHPDDLEEVDLRWQMAMLTIRARRFLKNTRRKLTVNGNETIGFDKYKVECYNCHKKGHFARECRALRNQENKNRENTRRVVPVETTTSNTLISCDGLESVEARLLVYKKNESVYEEDIKLLKREIHLREVAIIEHRRKLELAQKQKDEIQLTVEKYENLSKSLSKLIDCQIVDKCKTSLGYNAVPPPHTGNFMPPKPDLSFSGLEKFVNEPIVSESAVKKPVVETSEAKASADKPKVVKKNNGAPIIED
ncbi:ribonuclease H-like domain-containing protein, partial [Tanacetum coccineum]